MKTDEIIEQAKRYFGKNRNLLKKLLLTYKFDGSHYREWRKRLKGLTSQPFVVSYGIFDDVAQNLIDKNYKEIDWHWIGDLSWEIKVLLNSDIEKGYDWDKNLALKCGGTARIVQFFVSEVVPAFVYDTYYMTYSKSENYYEFGPILKLTKDERELVNKIRKLLQKSGLTFISKNVAMKHFEELYSDINSYGNASLFDALFSDTENYQSEVKRFNNKELKDPTGKKINWDEYYDNKGNLIRREEYRYFPSGNSECVVTDKSGQITEVRIRRDFGRRKYQEVNFDLLKEYKNRKKKD